MGDIVTDETTHVVSWVQQEDTELAEMRAEGKASLQVVSCQWLWDSINTTSRRPERPYLVG